MPSPRANYGAPTVDSESSPDDSFATRRFGTVPLLYYHNSTICTPGKYLAMISFAPLPASAMA